MNYEQSKLWRTKNPQLYEEYQARYRKKNQSRRNAQSREWNKTHPEQCRLASSDWSKRNRVYRNEQWHKRRGKLESEHSEDCTAKIKLLRLERFCRWCCTPLSKTNRTVDHIIPLNRGGHHIPDNLAASCARCNFARGDKLIHEWLPQQEFAA